VLRIAFETATESFFVEGAEFLRGFFPFSGSFGERWSLAAENARAVETGDGAPANVALRVEGPVSGNQDHCAGRSEIYG
jgi:hypothetical protein